MIERIDGLEALHGRVGDTASQILKSMKMNAAGPLLKSLQLENSNMKRQLDDAKKVSELQRQDAADKAALIKLKENDLRDLRDEIRVTKEKLKEATLKLKETVAMQAQQKALSPEPVVPVPPPTLPKPAQPKPPPSPKRVPNRWVLGRGQSRRMSFTCSKFPTTYRRARRSMTLSTEWKTQSRASAHSYKMASPFRTCLLDRSKLAYSITSNPCAVRTRQLL